MDLGYVSGLKYARKAFFFFFWELRKRKNLRGFIGFVWNEKIIFRKNRF